MDADGSAGGSTGKTAMERVKHHVQLLLFGAFLVLGPATLLAQAIQKAHKAVKKFSAPLKEVTSKIDVYGFTGFDATTALIVIGLCWVLGAVVYRLPIGQTAVDWIRSKFVRRGPLYKRRQARHEKPEVATPKASIPVLARISDVWHPGVTMDAPVDGWSPVFVPSIPSATTGQLYYVPEADVKELDVSLDDFRRTLMIGDHMSREWAGALAHDKPNAPAG